VLKERSHIIHGISDCCQSQLVVSVSRIVGLGYCLGEAGQEFGAVDGFERLKEEVISDINRL